MTAHTVPIKKPVLPSVLQERIASEFAPQIESWIIEGNTIEEIVQKLLPEVPKMSAAKLYQWMKAVPELKEAVTNGRVEALVKALFRKAVGCKMREIRQTNLCPAGGHKTLMREEVLVKEIPPDTAAAAFLLKNIKPDEWRDKHDIEAKGNINLVYDNYAVLDKIAHSTSNGDDEVDDVIDVEPE